MAEANTQLGTYTLNRKIGSGGMADVWMAERAVMGGARKTVAIKVLNAVSREKQEYRDMFLDEARLSMALNHSSIVQVFDAGECDGECFMTMEWVDGINLSQLNTMLWERGELLPLHIAVYIIGEVLRALDHAHNLRWGEESSVVHRDVSPQNVMVSVAGEVKLMDFGVARFSTEETAGIHVKGKLRYMPPEQLQGQSRDPTVDLFAVGAVLHEMIEGRRFRDDWDDIQLLSMIMDGVIPPLTNPDEVPTQVINVLYGLLEPQAHVRIGSARGALRMLTDWPGYKNASIDLESYVTRYRDLVPPLPPPPSGTGASGDVQARIAARAAAMQDGSSGSQRWRGVNPSTATTLDQVNAEATDDTNVGTLWPGRGPSIRRVLAAVVAALGMLIAGLTVGIALDTSRDPDEQGSDAAEHGHRGAVWLALVARSEELLTPKPSAESEPEPEPDSEPPPGIEDFVPPPAPPKPEPAPAPAPSGDAQGAAGLAGGAVLTDGPEPAEAGGELELEDEQEVAESPPPAPVDEKPRQKVKVTFVAHDFRFVYVKVAGKEMTLPPQQTIQLLEGNPTVKIRMDKSEPWQKVGRCRLRAGHDYEVLMLRPGGVKTVQVN